MATIITNQARLNYRFGTASATAVSNITSTILNSQLSVSKSALSGCYKIGQNITYIISITNNNSRSVTDITVADDLGSHIADCGEVTPLTFVGPAQLFINGVLSSEITPIVEDNGIIFEIDNIPANSNAQIIYVAQVNEFADGTLGSEITNTVIVDNGCDCPCEIPSTDTATVPVCEYADVRIIKSICPNPVICGERLTYTLTLYNYGNIPATDVVLTDTFNPALTDLVVTVDGVVIPNDDYDYINGTLTLPADDSDYEITIPPATFSRNSNCSITTTPGTVLITVSGNIDAI